MKLYCEQPSFKLYEGNSNDLLQVIEPNSIDAIITDPPYELNFMGNNWDNSGIAFSKSFWEKCLSVLKPGGILLAFGGTRTFHRLACAIEDAGFEIRDTLMYLYGSAMPKSLNIGIAVDKYLGQESEVVGVRTDCPDLKEIRKQTNGHLSFGGGTDASKRAVLEVKRANNKWQGWFSGLKPAYEPIIMARKQPDGTLAENVLKYNVGGLNIDECRVGIDGGVKKVDIIPNSGSKTTHFGCNGKLVNLNKDRYPANVITDGSDEVKANMYINDKESACRYFYCAKASRKDRDEVLENFESKKIYVDGAKWGFKNTENDNLGDRINNVSRVNIHPTVKATNLMQYLVRLVCPKGATILDPFMGSGSTGKAVMYENKERNKDYKFIGIEMTEKYLPIALARIEYARTNTSITLNELPEAQKSGLSENTVQTSNLNKLW